MRPRERMRLMELPLGCAPFDHSLGGGVAASIARAGSHTLPACLNPQDTPCLLKLSGQWPGRTRHEGYRGGSGLRHFFAIDGPGFAPPQTTTKQQLIIRSYCRLHTT